MIKTLRKINCSSKKKIKFILNKKSFKVSKEDVAGSRRINQSWSEHRHKKRKEKQKRKKERKSVSYDYGLKKNIGCKN